MRKRPSRDEAGVARLSVLYLGVVVLVAVGLALFTTPKRSLSSLSVNTAVGSNATAASPSTYRSQDSAGDDLGVALELPPGYTVSDREADGRRTVTFTRGDHSFTLTTTSPEGAAAVRSPLGSSTETAVALGPRSATKVTGVAAGGSSEAIFLIPANASVYVLTGSGSEFEDIATTIRIDDSKFR